jgi:DNA-binding NarL/FixJ family response regulator
MTAPENARKVAICETQPATAEGLRSLIEATPGLACAWSVASLPLAVQLARQAPADALIVDKQFGTALVVRALEELGQQCPATAVVVWGNKWSEAEAVQYLKAGARGLLRKTASLSVIAQCLGAVAQGAVWVEDSVMPPAAPRQTERLSELTPREQQVLELVRQGLRNREIAAALGIRPGTVKIHLKHIFEKTGIHGRYSLALNLLGRSDGNAARRAEVA